MSRKVLIKSLQMIAFLLLSYWCVGVTAYAVKEVTGKVLAVYHEPVVINNKTLDKVSVTVNSCDPTQQLFTASYVPGFVSDDNSLGYLYNHLAIAGRSSSVKNQYMNSVSGYVTLVVNDQANTINKTTFWGYNWECGRNIEGNTSIPGGGSAPASTQQQPPASRGGFGLPFRGGFGF